MAEKVACILCGGTVVVQRNLARCLVCGLTQVVPRPKSDQVAELYHEDFDHFQPYLEQIEVHRRYFREKLKLIQGKTLLDIGCAMGVLLEEAQKQGIEAYGVDISADAVAYCRKKGLRVSQTIPNKHFDVVTLFEVIEHEGDPLGLMKRVYKLLNNGGIAILTSPDHDTIWRKIMGSWWVGYRHPEHINFFNRQSLEELFHRAGFRQVEIKRDTLRSFPLSFLFTRSADYFPWAAWILKPIGSILRHVQIVNPVNPWGDIIAIGKKPR